MIDLLTHDLEKITNTKAGFYQTPIWSPSGDYIAFWTNAMAPDGVWAINVDGLEPFFIGQGQITSWSRNDELAIANIESSDSIKLAIVTTVSFKSNNFRRLYESDAAYPAFGDITWSPNGNYIAFSLKLANNLNEDVPATLLVIDRLGNVKLQISDQSIGNISWTSDSKSVIYFSIVKSQISLLKVIDLEGNCTEFQSLLWPIGAPRFSFDGSKIAFSGLDSKIYIVDTKSIFDNNFWEDGKICQ